MKKIYCTAVAISMTLLSIVTIAPAVQAKNVTIPTKGKCYLHNPQTDKWNEFSTYQVTLDKQSRFARETNVTNIEMEDGTIDTVKIISKYRYNKKGFVCGTYVNGEQTLRTVFQIKNGNLVKSVAYTPDGKKVETVEIEYQNGLRDKKSVTGEDGYVEETVRYAYDKNGNLIRERDNIYDPKGKMIAWAKTSYSYRKDGSLKKEVTSNSFKTHQTATFYTNGLVKKVVTSVPGSPAQTDDYHYTYYKNSKDVVRTELIRVNGEKALLNSYTDFVKVPESSILPPTTLTSQSVSSGAFAEAEKSVGVATLGK